MYSNSFVVQIRIGLNLPGSNQEIFKFACGAGQVKIHQLCIVVKVHIT